MSPAHILFQVLALPHTARGPARTFVVTYLTCSNTIHKDPPQLPIVVPWLYSGVVCHQSLDLGKSSTQILQQAQFPLGRRFWGPMHGLEHTI